eukprot:TRINITY_DN5776_c0_g1_i2.p1 TRINITY_DN5776_c0_g1~~TRINITY_DN5776_c0_g1_i2.p1  ORF type:complete len:196 (-),score=49.63 TRINITY_DN5776_c0_g1_i2:1051-1638(-)
MKIVKNIILKNSELAQSVEKVTCIGHSLGGGVAGVLCLLMNHDPELSHFQKRCVSYGSPPCISHEKKNAAIDKSMVSVVNGDDIIPRMRLEQIRFLQKAVLTYAEEGTAKLMQFVAKNRFASQEFTASDFERNLVLPGGRILLIGNASKLVEVDMSSSKKLFQSGSENMFVSSRILRDHACSVYVSNLSALKILG